MIFDFIKTKSGGRVEIEAIYNENVFLNIVKPENSWNGVISLYKGDYRIVDFISKPNSLLTDFFKKTCDKRFELYELRDEKDNYIGEICEHVTKGIVMGGYEYLKLKYNNKEYKAYPVGLGKEGFYICIYEEDKQIGLIDKELIIYDNKDKYKIYTLSEEYATIAVLFAAFYDNYKFGHQNRIEINKKERIAITTKHKELLSKYDPNFKNLC